MHKHSGSAHEHGLDIGSRVLVSKLYDRWDYTKQFAPIIDGERVSYTPRFPYSQISPFFQVQASPNWETGLYNVAPIINTTTQLTRKQLEEPPTERFKQVVREERIIPERFLTPIEPLPEGTMDNLQLEIKRLEFKSKHGSGGWCNMRIYAKFSPNTEIRALQLLDIIQAGNLESGFNAEIPLILVLSEVIAASGHEGGGFSLKYANEGLTVINGIEQALTDASAICQYMLGRQWDDVYIYLPERGTGTALGTQEEIFDRIIAQAPKVEGVTLTRAYPRHRYNAVKFSPSKRESIETVIGCAFSPVYSPRNMEDVNGY